MLLVDTSVWIDFFAGRGQPQVARLEQGLREGEDLALCGIVLTEIPRGIRDDQTYRQVRQRPRPLVMLPIAEATFVQAAQIFRGPRGNGITIRKTNDCIIAATALAHHSALLHNDKDFTAIASHYPLEITVP